jgi:exopolysaccharide biosynthesis polyprenyl glycosylphosphotransferase
MLSGLVAFAVSPEPTSAAHELWLLPTLPGWLVLFRIYRLYEGDVKRISRSWLDDLPPLFHALVVGTLGLWVYYHLIGMNGLTASQALLFGLCCLVTVGVLRWVARRLTMSLYGPERVLLIGDTPLAKPLLRKLEMHPEYGLDPVGLVPYEESRPSVPLPVVGTLPDLHLETLVTRYGVERAIIAATELEDDAMLRVLHECGRLGVKASVLPGYVDALGPSLEVDDIEGVTVLGLNPLVLPRTSRLLKRAMDLLGAGLGLLVLSPLLAIAAIAIKLDSRGPVLFRQQRIGRRGRRFTLIKFRTMVRDAEGRTGELWGKSEDRHWLKVESDPRITRVGRLLRLASLDELPQLWSVLRGDMGLVGPRPLIASEDRQIEGWARTRLDLAPGITGLWQVLGRTSIPFEEMLKLDTVYVTNWSLWLDIKLLMKTVPAVLSGRGVN